MGIKITILFQIVIYLILMCGLDLLRIFVGAFPPQICILINIMKGLLGTLGQLCFFFAFVFKFIYICVWKNMRIMDDFLILRLLVGFLTIFCLESSIIRNWLPGKLIMNKVCLNYILK